MAGVTGDLLVAPQWPGELLSTGLVSAAVAEKLLVTYYEVYQRYLSVFANLSDLSEELSDDGTSASVSKVSEPKTDPSVNSSASRSRAAKRARWRRNKSRRKLLSTVSVQTRLVVSEVGPDMDGRCFSKMFAEPAAVKLRPLCTFRELLAYSARDLLPDCDLRHLRLCRASPGVYHVGSSGAPLDLTLGALARVDYFPRGTVGYYCAKFSPGTVIAAGGPVLDDVVGASRQGVVERLVYDSILQVNGEFLQSCADTRRLTSEASRAFDHLSFGLSTEDWDELPEHARQIVMKLDCDSVGRLKAAVLCRVVKWYWSVSPYAATNVVRWEAIGKGNIYDPFQYAVHMNPKFIAECYSSLEEDQYLDMYDVVSSCFTYEQWAALPSRSRLYLLRMKRMNIIVEGSLITALFAYAIFKYLC